MTSVKSFVRRVVIAAPIALLAAGAIALGMSAGHQNATGARALASDNTVTMTGDDWPWGGKVTVNNVDWPWSIGDPISPVLPADDDPSTDPTTVPGDWPWHVV